MSLPPLDYPTDFDSASYFSFMAGAYNKSPLLEGISATWSSLPAPVYFTLQLLLMKLFGFSYTNALIIQAVVIGLLGLALLLVIYRYHQRSLDRPSILSLGLFVIVFLGLVAIGRFLSVSPSNVFDFRLEIIPSLLLTLALLTLALRNWLTAVCVVVAICERFHNLSVFLPTLLIWAAIATPPGFAPKPSSPVKTFLHRVWLNLRYSCLGFGVLLLLRGQQIYELFWYYTQHFGLDSELRGFGGWGSPGYFSFYPNSFFRQYLGFTAYPFLIVTAVALALVLRQGKFTLLSRSLVPFLPLAIGGVVAFCLLVIDPARNNTGVLRYAWVPILFAWIGLLAALMALLGWNRVRRSGSRGAIAVGLVLMLCVWGIALEAYGLRDYYQTFDHRGIRKFELVQQLEPVFKKLYRQAKAQPEVGIRIGATFNNEYNFHPGQWEMFLASHRLKHLPYTYLIGNAFYSPDFKTEQLPLLKQVDYVALGTKGCLVRGVPLNEDFKRYQAEVNDTVKQRCTSRIGRVKFQGCRIQILKCSE